MTKTLACKVPDEWVATIEEYCQKTGLSKSEVMKKAIAQYLNLDGHHQDQQILNWLQNLDDRVSQLENPPQQAYLEPAPAPVNRGKPKVNRGKPQRFLSFSEVCKVRNLDEAAIARRARVTGLTPEEALEITTGYRHTPKGFRW